MLGKPGILRKTVNFETSTNYGHLSKCAKVTSDDGSKNDGIFNKENCLRFNIPMSYVVSGAENIRSEAKCVQQLELVQKSCKIDEFCKDILNKTKKALPNDTASKHSSGNQVWMPNYRRVTERCSLFQESCIKKPRKQEYECSQSQRRIPTAKRRPLTTSNQHVWFMNKDTTSAILSSKNIAKKFKTVSKSPSKFVSHQAKKQGTRTELFDKVPKFTAVPNEYQNLCRNKSVHEIMDMKLCGKGYDEFHKRESQNCDKRVCSAATIYQPRKLSSQQWKHTNDETKRSTEKDVQRTDGCRRTPCTAFLKSSNSTTENLQIQVPKNIYIRKSTGRETMEDLVEVRNQDDLDVLNTRATLQLVESKHGSVATSGKCFKDLRDYEVYFYPC